MPGIKASPEEITDGTEAALAEAISQLDAVDGTSVAGLLDAYLDAAISSRSSHDWDPNGTVGTALDATVSSRSSHSWDPDGYIDQAISAAGASQSDIEAGAKGALAEAISQFDAVDGASVAGLLDAYLDATISSRSSHDWDPNGTVESNLDAPVSSAGGASPSEVEEAVNNAAINNDIYRAIERRVSQVWETGAEFGAWTGELVVSDDSLRLGTSTALSEDSNNYNTQNETYTTVVSQPVDVSDTLRLTVYADPDPYVYNGTPLEMSTRVQDTTNGVTVVEKSNSTRSEEYSATYDVSGMSGDITLNWDLRLDQREFVGEDATLQRAAVEESKGTATAESPLVGPPNTEWDVVNYDVATNGGSATVDVVDSGGTVVLSDVIDGDSLGSISASKDLRLRVSLSRPTLAEDPSLNRGILRWID
jgi:hypothetical protein